MRHCATNGKVAGLIPDGVIGIIHGLHPLTQTLAERITRGIWWGKGCRCVELTNLSPSCADCLEVLGASTSWIPKGQSRSLLGWLYPLVFYTK